ncbi:MAG TPA: nucleotidyltransferase family protein [Terriglobales bacterium]|nr:nucleotidyltransferase family protein [Terriglobales bacterium]
MAIAPSFCGVVLAAGESRDGRDKALLTYGGRTFLAGAIEALRPHTDMVLVVVGRNAELLSPVVYAAGAFLVENPEPERGQFGSLQAGLREVLNRGRDAAIVMLVDRPPVAEATIAQLRQAFLHAAGRGRWAVVPEHNGKHGHPLVVGREMIEAFLQAPVNSTAREVEHSLLDRIEYVAVSDPMVTFDVDSPEDDARRAAS